MIGKLCTTLMKYYDRQLGRMAFKRRPVLIIAQSDCSDYNVLPVSKVTDRSKLDPVFDIPLDPKVYPSLNLSVFSYVRTHKQTVINAREIGTVFGDMKQDYPDLYLNVVSKLEDYNKQIFDNIL